MTCAELHNVRLYFQNNTALEAGAALYGGSVDNCSLHFINSQYPQASSITRSAYPGGTIEVPIIAYGQQNGTTPAVIHVIHEHEIEVDNLENTQNIKNSCKLLRTFIAALFYTHLEYPNNVQIAVWRYDANIRYLSSKHLYSCSGLPCFPISPLYSVFIYFSVFIYWTGLMLLVRCILLFLLAFNALGDSNANLLAIGSITAVLLIVYAVYVNRLYKIWYLNILELFFIANLCILALVTLYIHSIGGNQNAVTFTSISIAFATFIGIITYHSLQQIKDTPRLWRRIFRQSINHEVLLQTDAESDCEDTTPPSPPDPSDGGATVAHINIRELLNLNELREPCTEMDN